MSNTRIDLQLVVYYVLDSVWSYGDNIVYLNSCYSLRLAKNVIVILRNTHLFLCARVSFLFARITAWYIVDNKHDSQCRP